MTFSQEIGTRLREIRKELQISQTDLAKQAGISLKTITNVEKGDDVSISILIKICKVLEIKPEINFRYHKY